MDATEPQPIFLVGPVSDNIVGNKLPSIRQVLAVLFHYRDNLKQPIKTCVKSAVNDVDIFWANALIPTQSTRSKERKLQSLYDEWKLLKTKTNRRRTKITNDFVAKLDDLFDVAHPDALKLLDEQLKQFLLGQRRRGREGWLDRIIDVISIKNSPIGCEGMETDSEKDELTLTGLEEEEEEEEVQSLTSCNSEDDDDSPWAMEAGNGKTRKKTINIISDDLVAALDRAKISDRNATYVLAAVISALGLDPEDYNISRSAIRRGRLKARSKIAGKIHDDLQSAQSLVVHWDGKLLPDLTGKTTVDRLPVLISGLGTQQLLSVPKLNRSTGAEQASAVAEVIQDWNIQDKIKAMCFDTTASNTGRLNGACVLLEQTLDKNLLHLACRNHVHELVLRSAFETCFPSTSGPDVLLFKRFQKSWEKLDHSQFEPGIKDVVILDALQEKRNDLLDFVAKQLKVNQKRDDYKELLELACIFLGGEPLCGLRFRKPGAVHHARWMAKAIYSLKIFMFKEQFKLTAQERTGLRDVCIFIARHYIEAWFTASLAASAPNNDLKFLKQLHQYEEVNFAMSKTTASKFRQHLWYLSEELVALAFFDGMVPIETKRKMAVAIKEREGALEPPKRFPPHSADPREISTRDLDEFVTKTTHTFFTQHNIPTGFLDQDPATWEEHEDYKKGLDIVKALQVVNDIAERGVALIEGYNNDEK